MGGWQDGFKGAAGGAMAGSFAGPWGAAVGGVLGGLGGMFGGGGGADYQKQLQELSKGFANRPPPQMGPAAQAGPSGLMGNRAGLVAQLEAMAAGMGPSAAQMQMQEAMERAAAAQSSAAMGAGGRGVNPGAAMLNATNNTAAIQAQGARDTATLRAQEQENAMGQLGNVLGQGIATDNQAAQWNAGAQNQASMANLQAALQTLGLNDESQLRALLAAMGGAGPSMGTQILAGGASAFPSGLQHWQGQQAPMQPQMQSGPVTSTGAVDPLAPYRRYS